MNRGFINILFSLCGDIESCPGPDRCIPELNALLKKRGIKIFHQNIRGLLSNIAYVAELLHSFPAIDIFTLSETHISDESERALFDLPGYTFISNHRKSGKGGGIGAYIADRIVWEERNDLENEDIELTWIEVKLKNSSGIMVGIIYRPPVSSKYLNKNFNKHLNEMLEKVVESSKEIILLGDINANYLVLDDSKEFKSILSLFGFAQMVKKPTRITESTETLIDIIATNNPLSLSDNDVIPTCIGDHDMVGCVRKVNCVKFRPRLITCRDYKQYEPEQMNNELRSVDWTSVYSSLNVNDAWHHMKSILSGIFEQHAPTIMKKVRGKPAPWLNNVVKSLMNARDKLLHKSRRTKANSDISQYKLKRNEVNTAVRKAKSTYYKNLLNENSSDVNKFWKTLKSIFPTKKRDKTSTRSFDIGVEKTTDSSQIANAFCSFFTQVIASLKRKIIPLRNFEWEKPLPIQMRTNSKFSFREVRQLEVMKQLKSIKRSKSTGIDDLPPNMLKDAASVISAPLTYLINLSMELFQSYRSCRK